MQEYIRCCRNQRRSLPATRETSSRNRFTITQDHSASRRSSEVDKIDMINLANDPLVRRHMPLSSGTFDEADYERFVADKERLWEEHGYGPWAFFVDGKFAGWGSLQPEDGDADVALVLNPDYWGTGRAIYEEIVT